MSDGLNAWPAGLLTRVRKLEKIYKTTVKLQPVNQGSVTAGNKILLQFPTDSVFDLKSLSFDAFVQTCQNGNQSGTAANNYTQTYYLPRNGLASLISQIDIRVGGRSIQNISQYNYLYNAITDWIWNGNNADEVQGLIDPSVMVTYDSGRIVPRRGYPVSVYNNAAPTSDTNNKYARLFDKYSCRRFIGLLGESSSSIINTRLLGDLQLELTLDGNFVLMAGSTVPNTQPIISNAERLAENNIYGLKNSLIAMADSIKAAATDSLNGKLRDIQKYNNLTRNFTYGDTGVPITGNISAAAAMVPGTDANFGVNTQGAIAADTTLTYTLSNISFSIVRYEFGDSTYQDAINTALSNDYQFELYFKNYQSFNGTPSTDKTQSMKITLASQSLNYVMATFQAPNRTTIQQPINTLISPPQAAETGVYNATFENQVRNGMPRTFNNSIYFLRNGSKLKTSKWALDSNEYPSRDIYDMYNENLRHWKKLGKSDATVYPGMQSLYHFQETFFSDVLSFEIDDQYNDSIFNVSGINCRGQPVNILYTTEGGADVTNAQAVDISTAANIYDANKAGFSANNLYIAAGAFVPILIANYTSKLVMSKDRNVEYFN